VRVTDMRGVDLSRYRFDFDLTFAVLLMHADGTVYHRYGGRDARDAGHWLSERALEAVLRAGLAEHERYSKSPRPPELATPLCAEDIPSFAKRDKGECIHCHSIHTSLYEEHLGAGGPPRDWIWRHPDPARIGLDLDRHEQRRITRVTPGSIAAVAGLAVGDELASLGTIRVASAADVMFALDAAPAEGGDLAVRFRRAGDEREATLALPTGWKAGTPRDFAWRPLKWALTPDPGFGGPRLTPDEMKARGLDPGGFAFRVQYLVTWGDNRRYGRAAADAGLREGDVVLSADGEDDFESVEHFHAWWRLTVDFGRKVRIETLRGSERRTIELVALR
jgi:hypothetical protein